MLAFMMLQQTIDLASRSLATIVLVVAIAVVARAAAASADFKTILGSTGSLGAGTVTSFVTTDAAGTPSALGLTLPDAALAGLPATNATTVVPLPRVSGLPFVAVVVDWEPNGHPPAGIYTVPHFDIHLYEIDESVRAAVAPTAREAAVTPAPDLVPLGYRVGAVVPHVGVLAASATAPEFAGQPFVATPIWGYWNGRNAFVEGMVTRERIASHARLDQAIDQPRAVTEPGRYPGAWHLTYDATKHETTVLFDGLVEH